MQTFDTATANRLRARLTQVLRRPAAYQVSELITILTEMLNALEHYANVVQVNERGNVVVKASESVNISNGAGSIRMEKTGDITIRGRSFDTKTSGSTMVKGAKIKQN